MLSNNVTLIGNLGSDIDMRQLSSGQTLGKVSLAVTRTYTTKSGVVTQDTSWFRLVMWGQTAERIAAQVGKGSRVLIEGQLKAGSYENKDGRKVETVDIVVAKCLQLQRTANTQDSDNEHTASADKTQDAIAEPAF